MQPLVSFIIPVRNEGDSLRRCIKSILAQKGDVEIILAVGPSNDNTENIALKYALNHKNIIVIGERRGNPAFARNLCLRYVSGDYIVNFSGHASLPSGDFVEKLLAKFETLDRGFGGVGFPNLPGDSDSLISRALGGFMAGSSAGFTQYAKTSEDMIVDHVPFVCYRREVFDKIGGFDENLPSGHDVDFNLRMKKAGYKLLFTPDVFICFERPKTLRGLAKKMFKYGRSRVKLMRKHPESNSIFHYGALALFPSTVILLFLSLVSEFFFMFLVFVAVFYLILSYLSLLRETSFPLRSLYGLVVYPVIHFSYSIGMIRGLIER